MAIDWTAGMQQTFEYYIVDPSSWQDKQRIDSVISSSINRDYDADTRGSASFNVGEQLGECYIRTYLSVLQNGESGRFPLGTYLVQTPSFEFDGKKKSYSLDAYTPLLELSENPPPLGFSVQRNENVMEHVCNLTAENCRAPVVDVENATTLYAHFTAETNDTWLTYLSSLMANAKYRYDLDEMGRILFAPEIETDKMQPVWTFNDDNSSILLPDLSVSRDLYKIPNTVEVLYTSANRLYYATAVNEDPDSPTSVQSRGRVISYREMNPSLPGLSTEPQIEQYAKDLLKKMSALEYKVTFSHGYCPVRTGDCVRLNYNRAGLQDVKAKIISQSINCTSGCTISSTAVYTKKLWE